MTAIAVVANVAYTLGLYFFHEGSDRQGVSTNVIDMCIAHDTDDNDSIVILTTLAFHHCRTNGDINSSSSRKIHP
jgi:hypothetical protein